MGFRNHVGRGLLLLGLALAVGIAVALTSGDWQGRTVAGSHALVVEHPTTARRGAISGQQPPGSFLRPA